mgnify:FL=1
MPSFTIDVDADLERKMGNHPTVDWGAVDRHAIEERAQTLELLDELTEDADLSEGDAAELADRIDEIAQERIDEES